jgi:hypothetical protein
LVTTIGKAKVEAKSPPVPVKKVEADESNPAKIGTKEVETQPRSKPLGFGKPAIIKLIPSQSPPVTMQPKEGMTAEEAAQVREERLSGKSEEQTKEIPSLITEGMTADEAEVVREARLADSSESQPTKPENVEETTKESPKSAQVYVGTIPKFIRTNPPKEAASPRRVANALKALAMGSSERKTETTRPLLKLGETSLSKLVAKGGAPHKQPVQKMPTQSVENRSLKDLLSKEKPIGSGRKTSSTLGAIASPEEKPRKEEHQQARKEKVIAASVVEKKPASAASVVSSLSALVKNGSSAARRSSGGLNEGMVTSSKLGDIAGEVEPSIKQKKVMNAAKHLAPATRTNDDTKPVKNNAEAFHRSMLAARIANDSKANASAEAFHRSMLAARIANDSKASAGSKLKSSSTSLTDIILGQERPTLAQQNVVTADKRTSLFPPKKESRLSRLIKK